MKEKTTVEMKKLPAFVACTDYHDFNYLERALWDLGLKLKVEECAFARDTGLYYGIVYRGRRPTRLLAAIKQAVQLHEETDCGFNLEKVRDNLEE